MKNFVKYGVVGLIGYFIGFHEMKYKTMKAVVQVLTKNDEEEKEPEE